MNNPTNSCNLIPHFSSNLTNYNYLYFGIQLHNSATCNLLLPNTGGNMVALWCPMKSERKSVALYFLPASGAALCKFCTPSYPVLIVALHWKGMRELPLSFPQLLQSKHARRALHTLVSGCGLLVSEIFLDGDRRGPRRGLLQALGMSEGRQRSAAGYSLLLEGHGFVTARARHTGNVLDALLCTKA